MPERKPHIELVGFASQEDFQSRGRPQNPIVPLRERVAHGQYLSQQYSGVLEDFSNQRERVAETITEDIGIYIDIVSYPGCSLPLDSLDNRDYKLCSCRKMNDQEIAVVFVPESRRLVFQQKLDRYLDEDKDGKHGPSNHNLIDSISEISIANLHSFWTDDVALFPEDPHQVVWWELWLKKRDAEENALDIAHQLADRINVQMGTTSLSFFGTTVALIRASSEQLSHAPELIANLAELRQPKETPNALVHSSAQDQHEWIADLNDRLSVEENVATAVTILDAGVN